jgi:hypothetical protein
VGDRLSGTDSNQESRPAEAFPGQVFISGNLHGLGRMKRQPQSLGCKRCDPRLLVPHCDNPIGLKSRQLFGRFVRLLEAYGYRLVTPRVVQYVATIRPENHLNSHATARLGKCSRLIPGGCGHQEDLLIFRRN